VEVGCLSACKDRIVSKTNCPVSNTAHCEEPIDSDSTGKELKCKDTHVMRFDSAGEDWDKEILTCNKKDFKRKNNEVAFELDITDPMMKFPLNCISKCANEFVTDEPTSDAYASKNPVRTPSNLKCETSEILRLGKNFVFHSAECKDKGWFGPADQVNPLINFETEFKTTATCLQVCAPIMIEKMPEEKDIDSITIYRTVGDLLECRTQRHKLFVNEKETEPVKCSGTGWKTNTGVIVVDHTATGADPTKKVRATCKHQCNKDFVTDSCVPASDPSCTKAIYENRKLSCAHPSEILVIEYNGASKESFDNLECGDGGWKDSKLTIIHALAYPVFDVKVKCEQVCHPTKLTGPVAEVKSRHYMLSEDGQSRLTCKEEKEMLKFNGNDVYSDMICSKEGWVKVFDKPNKIISFVPDSINRDVPAICVQNKCVDRIPAIPADSCASTPGDLCVKLDYTTEKYRMKCKDIAIQKTTDPTWTYTSLKCDNNKWQSMEGTTKTVLDETEPFNLVCFAKECSKCGDSVVKIACDETDNNCIKHSLFFTKGQASYCSQYRCTPGEAYKVEKNEREYTYYPYDDNKRVMCNDNDQFATPDKQSTVAKLGCVKQIPCTEHSPLNLECPNNIACDANLLSTLQKDELNAVGKNIEPSTTKCTAPNLMYHQTGNNTYATLDSILCQKDGTWKITYADGTTLDKILPRGENQIRPSIFCSPHDPTIPPPPTTTPPPRPCDNVVCPDPPLKKCDGCEEDRGSIKRREENGGCIAQSDKQAVIVFNNDEETSDAIICDKTTNGKWKTKDGKIIAQIAARKKTLADVAKSNWIYFLVGGIVLVLLVGGLVGFCFYMRVRRRRESERLEALKSKGLEQKNDTIIDNVSMVDDPKTLIL
ncbi:hypothetical protein PFISCL1PPCAC_25074, partial [Pristionchus fissidentatus]